MSYLNVHDFEKAAEKRLSKMAFGYYASGANDGVTLRRNRQAFQDLSLYHRVLQDVGTRDLSCTLLGQSLAMPIVAAPTAFHQLAHEKGEVATAKGVAKAQSLMTLSTLSNCSVERVAVASDGSLWFQLYIYKDRGITAAMLDRVVAAGCRAIVFTVDAPLLGRREQDIRNQFHLPVNFRMENLLPHGYEELGAKAEASGLAAYFASLLDPCLTWSDLEWISQRTKLPVLVKGIVHPQDAILALEHGAAGVIVSNHGGRQLDTGPASIQALPGVAKALADKKTQVGQKPVLMMDGGIRRGTDILKALALGADAVMLGRPILWGLAVDGSEGVATVLNLLKTELELAMALCGCRTIEEITNALIFHQ